MSINTIIKLLNFLIERLQKEAQRLTEQAFSKERLSEDLRIEAAIASGDAVELHRKAEQAERMAGKVVQLIKD